MSLKDRGPMQNIIAPAHRSLGRAASAAARYDEATETADPQAILHALAVLAAIKTAQDEMAVLESSLKAKLAAQRDALVDLLA